MDQAEKRHESGTHAQLWGISGQCSVPLSVNTFRVAEIIPLTEEVCQRGKVLARESSLCNNPNVTMPQDPWSLSNASPPDPMLEITAPTRITLRG